MIALRSPIIRGGIRRTNLDYVPYSRATWQKWCATRGIEFILVDSTIGEKILPDAPPTVQRWFVPYEIVSVRGPDTQVAMVDADTMVRWDTPDFFSMAAGSLTAVSGRNRQWILRSIRAFQDFFPAVNLSAQDYFNAGFVVLGSGQLGILDKFIKFYRENEREIQRVFLKNDVGTDQTPLNFFMRREQQPVKLLPREFNLLHCFGYHEQVRMEYESCSNPDWNTFENKAFTPDAFNFISKGYIWHFTNTLVTRKRVMAETWRRVRHFYPSSKTIH